MAYSLAFIAGLLMLTSTKASDTTGSGFLSKTSKTSLGDYNKFVTQRVNHKAANSLSYQSGSAADWTYDGMSFSTASDRLAAPAQDSMAFTSARVVEDPAVQKLLATDSSMRIGMPAMGVALLAFAAMLGIHMRRRQHQATTFASVEDESDMSIALADRTNSPVSVFDPLGLFADSENKHYLVKRYGGAELTHGRVAMFAGSSMAFSSQRGLTRLNAIDDEEFGAAEQMTGKGRLGSSIDQDGKSNIWAVEPKMKVDEEGGGPSAAAYIAEKKGCRCKAKDMEAMGKTTCAPI
jgi:hypothetical protein